MTIQCIRKIFDCDVINFNVKTFLTIPGVYNVGREGYMYYYRPLIFVSEVMMYGVKN